MFQERPEWEGSHQELHSPGVADKDGGEGLAFPGAPHLPARLRFCLRTICRCMSADPNSCKQGKELSINSQGSRVG